LGRVVDVTLNLLNSSFRWCQLYNANHFQYACSSPYFCESDPAGGPCSVALFTCVRKELCAIETEPQVFSFVWMFCNVVPWAVMTLLSACQIVLDPAGVIPPSLVRSLVSRASERCTSINIGSFSMADWHDRHSSW
jgi:hypothetical protein